MASIGGKQAAFGAEKQSDRVVKKGAFSKYRNKDSCRSFPLADYHRLNLMARRF